MKQTTYMLYFLLIIPLLCAAYDRNCYVSKEIINVMLREEYTFWDSVYDDSDSDEGRITYQYKISCENIDINSELPLESYVNESNKEQANLSVDIRIENSKLNNLSVVLLKGMNSVNTLRIINCNLNYIEPNAINMINLTSVQLKNNNLTEIQNGTFKNLSNLKEISLENNKIKTLESIQNCPSLTSLFLDYNQLTTIDEYHFHNLLSLKFLNLSSNNISSIHADAFKNLLNLNKLNLDNNNLETISSKLFTNLQMLKFLDISHNHIKEIIFDEIVTHNINGLRYYWLFLSKENNLGFNNLLSVPTNISNMNSINSNVDLSNNSISMIKHDDFKNMDTTLNLNLRNNKIESIDIGAFKDMTTLRGLDMAYNKLKELKSGVFTGLNNLRSLNLSNNEFTTFDSTVYFTMEGLREIDFSRNYLHSLNTTELHFSGLQYISLDFHHIGCHSLISYIKAFKAHGITIRRGYNFLTENVNGISCNHSHSQHHTTTIASTTIVTTAATTKVTTVPTTEVTSTTTTSTTKTTPVTDVVITETSTKNLNISGKAYEVSQPSHSTHAAIITTSVLVVIAGLIVAVWFGRKYYYQHRNTDIETNYRLINVMQSEENSRH